MLHLFIVFLQRVHSRCGQLHCHLLAGLVKLAVLPSLLHSVVQQTSFERPNPHVETAAFLVLPGHFSRPCIFMACHCRQPLALVKRQSCCPPSLNAAPPPLHHHHHHHHPPPRKSALSLTHLMTLSKRKKNEKRREKKREKKGLSNLGMEPREKQKKQ